jgi:hypothetical protein
MPLKRALTTIGTSASRRVTIFVSKAVNYKVIDKFTDENGRIVLLNVQKLHIYNNRTKCQYKYTCSIKMHINIFHIFVLINIQCTFKNPLNILM